MEVVILGSGVGVPNLKRSYPGLFIKSETDKILVDPGPGSLRQLLKAGFSYREVDSIVFTHFHPDHSLDLISFLFACKYPLRPREKRLFLIGAVGLENFYKASLEIFGKAITPEAFDVSIKEVREETIVRDKTEMLVKPVAHTETSIGIRYIDAEGSVVCYSGDTDYCNSLLQLAKNADVLILECSFPDEGKVKGHLTPSFAGRIAREADAKRLVLTHLYPVCDGFDIISQCRKEFAGEVQIASDLMKISI